MLYLFTLFERTAEEVFDVVFDVMFVILYPLIMATILSVIVNNISIKKLTRKNIIIYAMINYIIVIILHSSKKDIFLLPIITVITVLYITIVTKSLYESLVVAFVSDIVFALSDAVVGAVIIYGLNLDYNHMVENEKSYFIVGIFILLCAYVVSKAVKLIINKMQIRDYNFKEYIKDNLLIIVYIILGLCSIYIYLIISKEIDIEINRVILTLYLLLIAGFFIFAIILTSISIKNIKIKLEQQYREQEYKQLKEYTNMLEIMSNDLRRFKHDYVNILRTLGSYIETKDIKGLEEFYRNELLPESNVIIGKNKSLSLLQHINITALKGLISSKIIEAQSMGIDTNIEIIDDINDLPMSIIDICRIIGILLDNAIEAAVICDVKKISFMIAKNEDHTVFLICNSCSKDVPSVHKIYEKDFSTKGQGRGMGLKTVRSIIDNKYDNVLINTKIKDSVFTQELVIFNRKNDN